MPSFILNTPEKIVKLIKKLPNGCWKWIGAVGKNGYGKVRINYKNLMPHRISYEFFKGEIPKELVIDHLCKNRICINPEHLEAVTLKKNILRGESNPVKHSRQIYCIRNHPLFGINLYITPDGRRQCKICNRIRSKNLNKSRGVLSLRYRKQIISQV